MRNERNIILNSAFTDFRSKEHSSIFLFNSLQIHAHSSCRGATTNYFYRYKCKLYIIPDYRRAIFRHIPSSSFSVLSMILLGFTTISRSRYWNTFSMSEREKALLPTRKVLKFLSPLFSAYFFCVIPSSVNWISACI